MRSPSAIFIIFYLGIWISKQKKKVDLCYVRNKLCAACVICRLDMEVTECMWQQCV